MDGPVDPNWGLTAAGKAVQTKADPVRSQRQWQREKRTDPPLFLHRCTEAQRHIDIKHPALVWPQDKAAAEARGAAFAAAVPDGSMVAPTPSRCPLAALSQPSRCPLAAISLPCRSTLAAILPTVGGVATSIRF